MTWCGTQRTQPREWKRERRTEQRQALTASFGVGNAQLKAGRIDVLDLEVSGLGEAQAAAEDGHEEDAGQGIVGGADGDQALDLLDAQDAGRLGEAGRAFDADEQRFEVLAQQAVEEGPQGVDGEVDGGGGELALGDEMEYPGANLRWAELVGRAVMELGQVADPGGVGLDGARGFLLEDEVIDEPLAERGDGGG